MGWDELWLHMSNEKFNIVTHRSIGDITVISNGLFDIPKKITNMIYNK